MEENDFPHGSTHPAGRVTISIGVANCPVDATEQDRLVDCADAALYASKRAGRNGVTAYATGMELHPGRARGPRTTSRPEMPAVSAPATRSGSMPAVGGSGRGPTGS